MGVLGTITNLATGGLFQGIGSLIDHIKGKSPEDAAKLEQMTKQYAAEIQLVQLQQESDKLKADVTAAQMQADVNKVEAASPNMFIAGWRPAIGWTCCLGLAYQFVLSPVGTWVAEMWGKHVSAPSLDMGTLLTLLFGMLGLGGMRMYEKINNAQGNH